MKRLISTLLALVMLIALLPTLPVTAAGTAVTWSGDGDWLGASARIDNTQSYELTYDVHFSAIMTAGNDTWADDSMLVIRNETADHYIKFQLQAYRNGGGNYQVAPSVQVWQGNTWSDRDFFWSADSAAPITDVSMQISYNKDTSVYSWIAKNKADGGLIASGSFAAERMTNELKSCNDCALTFYRSNTGISVSNTVLTYGGTSQEELPQVGNMTGWTTAEGWSYDAAAGTLTQNTVNGSWCTWNQLFNGANGFTFSTKISFTSEIAAPNNWGDVTAGYIRDAGSGNYLKFSIRSYMNGESEYQLAVVLQYWDEASSTWSPEQFYWANKLFDTVPPTVDFALTCDEETKLYSWSLKDGTQDIQSGSLTAGYLPAAFCDSITLTVMLGSNGFGKVSYSAMNIDVPEVTPDTPVFAEDMTPGDFGWSTDAGNFTGWKTTQTGDLFFVEYDGVNSKRIWKSLIQDPDNFTLKATVKIANWRAELEIMGVHIELNCEHGNGNQIFDRESWNWFNAAEQTCEVTIARTGGGDLTVKLLGKGNPEPVVFTKTPANPADTNLYVGVIDNTGAAYFSDLRDDGISGQNAGDFGWDTDEIEGAKDFSGWTTVDGINITANYADTVGNHRIWRSLITSQDNFAVKTAVTAGENASAYIKVLGQTLELDTRGGDGKQIGVKVNGEFKDWIAAEHRTVSVYLIRKNNGAIRASVVGGDGVRTYTMTPAEESENVELGSYAGTVIFADLRVTAVGSDLRMIPFGTTAFVGEYAGAWADVLCADISEYQNNEITATIHSAAEADSVKADLIVISTGVEAYLSGTTANEFLTELKTYIETVKANQEPETVIVVTGLPYLGEDGDLGLLAAYNAGIRVLAEEEGVLYADLYTAMGQQSGTLAADGSPTAMGRALIAGEVLEELMRACTCLAVNSTTPIKPIKADKADRTQAALDAFIAANDTASMKAVVENEALGVSLDFYRTLTNAAQAKTVEKLVAMNRAGATFTKADELVTLAAMQAAKESPKPDYTKQIGTYVSVGDSITEGAQAVNSTTDGYAPRFAALLNSLTKDGITFINKGISGTRMCTVTDNGMFPAAKDTVDSYIVPHAPDLLSVAYGINDFHAGTTLEEFLTTYRAYITEIQTKCPDTLIMLFELTAKGNNADMEALRTWNAGIKQIAEDLGCIYVGTYDDMRGVEWLLDDGLHPTNAGYRVLANAALRAFNSYVDMSGNEPQPAKTPEAFGWETDEIDGIKDFTGWTATDEANISADNSTVGEHRIWKSLLPNQESFTAELDLTVGLEGSAYVKLLGVIIELDARGGDGNQVYVKLPGSGNDWLAAEGRAVHVKIERSGDDLTVTLTGKGNETPVVRTASPTEENENVELGLYAGAASFKNITVSSAAQCAHEHTEVRDAKQASCTDDGYTGDTYCTDCGEKLADGSAIAALGHAWDEGTVTKEPTDTEDGEKTYTCTRCDATKTEPIAKLADPCEGYTDIDRTAWYHGTVDFVIDGGYMGSTSTDKLTFAPTTKVSRAMVAQILYSIAGEGEKVEYQGTFSDVPEGKWFTNAVEWCAKNGLAAGSNGKFKPNGNVTRQELTVFMRSLAKYMGKDVTGRADLAGFPDANKVPGWAKDAVEWAVDYGIISGQKVGDQTYLNPAAGATRAELAAILKSFLTK